MKRICIIIALLTFHLSTLSLSAAVPLRWTVETSRLQPAVFDVVRGETLDLEASFQSYGKPVATSNMTAFLCWQTNGMASAWWVTNACTAAAISGSQSNVARVLFTPEMDPGVPVVYAFLGLSDTTNSNTQTLKNSNNYRAAITLRFRPGPGAVPNAIEQPPRILDLAHTVVVNSPWPTQADFAATTTVMKAELKGYVDDQITGAGLVSPTMTTNIAGKVVSNVVTKAFVEDLGIEAGLTEEQVDDRVKSSSNTNLGAVAAAQAMTNNLINTSYNDTHSIDLFGWKFVPPTDSPSSPYPATIEVKFGDYFSEAIRFGGPGTTCSLVGTWNIQNGWDYLTTEYGMQTLPSYLASLAWHPSNASLSSYGITDAYTKDEADSTFVSFSGGTIFGTIGAEGFQAIQGWQTILAGDIQTQTLPEYLASTEWHGTDKSLDDYGITDSYTKNDSDSRFVPRSLKINGQTLSNDVTIAAGVTSVNSKTGDVTLVASDVGAYPETSGNQLASQVATQGAHLNAEDAKLVVTNYDSQVNIPEAEVKIKLQQGGTNVWRTIWEEMRRWNAFCGKGFNWQTWGGFHTWSTNILAMIEETSPKEYAFYDGTTGEVAPDGFFWISQPRIGICAGAGYQRYLDAGGAVWILESNGLVANIGGTTNGYFRISDEDGNTQFEIIKGDKQTVPATARSIRSEIVMGVSHWFCDYAVTNALAAPTAKFCRNIGANPPVWIADTEASCPCNVTWTPGVNTYTLEFWPKSTEPTMFCKAEYDRGGETRIRQSVPTEMQYIILNGTKYGLTPKTINGELVMGLTTGN